MSARVRGELHAAQPEVDLCASLGQADGARVCGALRGPAQPEVDLCASLGLADDARVCGALRGPAQPEVDLCARLGLADGARVCGALRGPAQPEVDLCARLGHAGRARVCGEHNVEQPEESLSARRHEARRRTHWSSAAPGRSSTADVPCCEERS